LYFLKLKAATKANPTMATISLGPEDAFDAVEAAAVVVPATVPESLVVVVVDGVVVSVVVGPVGGAGVKLGIGGGEPSAKARPAPSANNKDTAKIQIMISFLAILFYFLYHYNTLESL
jgi:hypothetical protein